LLWREIAKSRGILSPDLDDVDSFGEPMAEANEDGWAP